MNLKNYRLAIATLLISMNLTGCVSTIVGGAVDLTIEAAKVPFKVGGAIIDVATGDAEEDEKES